ncbi:triacylglycerol lipase [Hahella sp. CCB-MM4]|uniref:esterase/lipase family protein n=1 Tax=Hahella sp. (strain CCB-MM4) TaxID=1926491 RepID=UPI001FEDE0CA|nr:alpha/beta fold hydrolase [Hahella sp. CCB-MM4]
MIDKNRIPHSLPLREAVILLHGLARTPRSMRKLENALSQSGYIVLNQGYPSRHFPIPELAETYVGHAVSQCRDCSRIHFVTHSMGGILVRQYLHHHPLQNVGRVVMLAPPNQGSQVVDKLGWMPAFKYINGPAGQQLGTQAESIPNCLPGVSYETAIIAGNRSINFLLSTLLPGENDGKVTVASTKLSGMKEHMTLPVTHPLIMNHPKVINEVLNFLQYGRFHSVNAL